MKNKLLAPLILLFLGLSFSVSAQSVSEKMKSAKVIYVAPLTDFDYYAIKEARTNSKGAYDHKNKYEVGDFVDDAVDPNFSYEIVGSFTPEMLAEVNNQVLNKLKSIYGEDKVKAWPDDMVNKMTGFWNQKDIDCDFYFIFKRMSSNNPVLVKFIETGNPGVSPKVGGGMDMFTINLYEKTKPGKKGSEVAKAKGSIFKDVEPIDYNGDYKEAANNLTKKANENFPKLVDSAMNELLSQIGGI